MIDWFVLLTPLVLLPIVFLFGFVGCTLDQTGKGPPAGSHDTTIYFSYEDGLDSEVEGIEISFELDAEMVNSGAVTPNKVILAGNMILAGGETIAMGDVPLKSHGYVRCTCFAVLKSGPPHFDWTASAYKNTNELGPTFTLYRGGGGELKFDELA